MPSSNRWLGNPPDGQVLRPVIEAKGGWVPLVDVKTDANVAVRPGSRTPWLRKLGKIHHFSWENHHFQWENHNF